MWHKVSLFLLSFTESMYGRVPVSVVTHVVMPPYLLRSPVITNVRVQADEDTVLVEVTGRLSRGPAGVVSVGYGVLPDPPTEGGREFTLLKNIFFSFFI